jgi:dipeptidyl-peptidase-4
MDWAENSTELIVAQLNRHQNECNVFLCNIADGSAKSIYHETSDAWIDVSGPFEYDSAPWTWLDHGKAFLWTSEKDGWRHIYRISRDGGKQTLLTRGDFDADFAAVDETVGRQNPRGPCTFMPALTTPPSNTCTRRVWLHPTPSG